MGVPSYQLTTNFWANCQLTVNPISTLLIVVNNFQMFDYSSDSAAA